MMNICQQSKSRALNEPFRRPYLSLMMCQVSGTYRL